MLLGPCGRVGRLRLYLRLRSGPVPSIALLAFVALGCTLSLLGGLFAVFGCALPFFPALAEPLVVVAVVVVAVYIEDEAGVGAAAPGVQGDMGLATTMDFVVLLLVVAADVCILAVLEVVVVSNGVCFGTGCAWKW